MVGGTRGGACLGPAVKDTHTGARTVVIGREVGRNIMGRATGGGGGAGARVCLYRAIAVYGPLTSEKFTEIKNPHPVLLHAHNRRELLMPTPPMTIDRRRSMTCRDQKSRAIYCQIGMLIASGYNGPEDGRDGT